MRIYLLLAVGYQPKIIVVVAEEAGFSNVRTLQHRIQEAIGISPVDYRIIPTRDM
ncbi:MAG: hypothetical protein J6Z14_06670 [Prevotella sp.]|nr:hypothetical protein [Prevotella sp.]